MRDQVHSDDQSKSLNALKSEGALDSPSAPSRNLGAEKLQFRGRPLVSISRRFAWLALLNFVVLQWFGVRLARMLEPRFYITDSGAEIRHVQIGWFVLRWVVPLTGWWSNFIWIRRTTPGPKRRVRGGGLS